MVYPKLNPDKALIWRILHRDNLPWVLDHGLHCGHSAQRSAQWVSIGQPELISKRGRRPVPCPPHGVLNDYVPFYFTPFSVMLYNILTGQGGVPRRGPEEIVILVSSLHRVDALGLPFVFTDMHAYYPWATFHTDLARLDGIDWPCCSGEISGATPMIQPDSSAIRRRRWSTAICRSTHCSASCAAPMHRPT
jgi:hypothetical protein